MKRSIFSMMMVLVIALSSLVACSSSSAPQSTEEFRSQSPSVAPGGSTKGGTATDSSAPSTAASGAAGQTFLPDRMIIYTANLALTVKDVAQSMDLIADIVATAGGVVAGTNAQTSLFPDGKDSTRTVSLTLQVPSTKYQDVMSRLRKLATKPPDESSSSQDVTEEYSDQQAQLRNLQVVEAQYAELLKRANTIDEILKVQQKLGETRGQIERIKGRIIYLERRSDMATITVTLRPESSAKNSSPQNWDPIKVASDSWEASMIFLQAVGSVVIALAVFFWWLIPLAILAVIAWRLWRNHRRRAIKTTA